MSRYFFHVQNQESFTRDDIGIDLNSADRVRDSASDSAGEILTSDLRDGKTDIRFEIQVEDEDARRIMTLNVISTLDRP